MKRARRVAFAGGLVIAALVAGVPGGALAAPTTPTVTTLGGHFVRSSDSVPVVLRGFDVPYWQPALAADAVAAHATMVRVPVPWSAVEPAAPVAGTHTWDQSVLTEVDTTVRYFQAHGVQVLIDFHQVHWSPYFASVCQLGAVCGGASGVPAWYYADGRFPLTLNGVLAAQAAFFTTEAARSGADYSAFAQMMATRYAGYPNVVGYGIVNEPQPGNLPGRVGFQSATTTMLRWQAVVARAIRVVEPVRALFVSVRGGGEGVGTADFSVFGGDPHLVLDFHDFFNGLPGYGLDATGDNWRPDWPSTHMQYVTSYAGTEASQAAVLAVPLQTARRFGMPLFIGEWGARSDDVHGTVYQTQMLDRLDRNGLSWTRWTLGASDRFTLVNGDLSLTAQGAQLASALAPAPPHSVDSPAALGPAAAGYTLHATHGYFAGSPVPLSFTYRWLRCRLGVCSAIPGETTSAYVLTESDVGAAFEVTVTATNPSGSVAATSAPTRAVIGGPRLAVTLSAVPQVVSAQTTVTWHLNKGASYQILIKRPTGYIVRHFISGATSGPVTLSRPWKARNDSGFPVLEGWYAVSLTAWNAAGERVTRSVSVVVRR